MPLELQQKYDNIKLKINSYNTTVENSLNELEIKKQSLGDNLEQTKSEALKQINNLGSEGQRLQNEIKNQYEHLIDIFKMVSSNAKAKVKDKVTNIDTKYDTLDFLLKQVLQASQNTKSRIDEIFINEVISAAGCSEEQEFLGCPSGSNCSDTNKIYISLKKIDLFSLIKNDPSEGNNSVLYERNETSNGTTPYSMNREIYKRTQDEGVSFFDEYGNDYIGASNSPIMDMRYVTSYNDNGVTINGDFLEITLRDRINGNNLSDFLRDYYKSIKILDFDDLSAKIMNLFTNFIDLSVGLSTSEKSEQTKFEKIIQRILGLCFDDTKEIDVSGTAKLSDLDVLDESFFELSPQDLRNIEVEIENFKNGVVEFKDCGDVKLPVDLESISDSLNHVRDAKEGDKVDTLITEIEKISKNDKWKLLLPDGINVDLTIKEGILKIIPKAVIMTILGPKTLLGLFIALKAVGSTISDLIEDFTTFIANMKQFIVNLVSKIGAIFVEELFKLLKKNIRQLVQTLMVEIIKESKNAQLKIITTIIYILLQLTSAAIDWRQCKSVVDEILNLLNLIIPSRNSSVPLFALASSQLLGGYSPTRAITNITENFQKLGLPTGPLPDGSPNIAIPAIFEQIKGHHDEFLSNAKTEVFIPPLAVAAVGAGTTSIGRGWGKTY